MELISWTRFGRGNGSTLVSRAFTQSVQLCTTQLLYNYSAVCAAVVVVMTTMNLGYVYNSARRSDNSFRILVTFYVVLYVLCYGLILVLVHILSSHHSNVSNFIAVHFLFNYVRCSFGTIRRAVPWNKNGSTFYYVIKMYNINILVHYVYNIAYLN